MGKRKPQRAKRPCSVSSCGEFVTNSGYCDKHQDKVKTQDRLRGTAHERGYGSKWNKARDHFLNEHPLCCDCMKRGYIVPASVVDHIIPHKGDKVLFWNEQNWQQLCESCHNRKTATEDRGSWSYQQPIIRANRKSENIFKINDVVLPATDYIQDVLGCGAQDQFTVVSVSNKTIQITNGLDGGHYHHSHFKGLAT